MQYSKNFSVYILVMVALTGHSLFAQPVERMGVAVEEAPPVSSGRYGSAGSTGSSGYGAGPYSSYSGSRSGNYEDIPELSGRFDAGKNYDSTVARMGRIFKTYGALINRNYEDVSSYNVAEKRHNYQVSVSMGSFKTIKDILDAMPGKVNLSQTTQRAYFADTARIIEELKYYKREKEALSKMLDTMSPANPKYRATSQQVLNLISQISSKQNEWRETDLRAKYPCKINIQIYTSYDGFYNRSSTPREPVVSPPKYRSSYYTGWKHRFIPGISYIGMKPVNADSLGLFTGIAPELSLFSRFRGSGGDYNPSFQNLYVRLGVLKSDKSGIPKTYYTGLGVRFSFENKARRQYLIPFFGDEFSYVNNSRIGGALLNSPNVGVYLIATKQVQAYFSAGYVYPFKHRESYESYTFSGGISYLLWR